jgi:hypothetical protein
MLEICQKSFDSITTTARTYLSADHIVVAFITTSSSDDFHCLFQGLEFKYLAASSHGVIGPSRNISKLAVTLSNVFKMSTCRYLLRETCMRNIALARRSYLVSIYAAIFVAAFFRGSISSKLPG